MAGQVDGGTARSADRRTGPRFVAVSNRLPIVLERSEDGWTTKPGSGGLVTALAPVLSNRGGLVDRLAGDH